MKNLQTEYSTIDLIDDLKRELQIYSEILAEIFPKRLKEYSDRTLSLFWKGNYNFVQNIKKKIKSNNHSMDELFDDLKILKPKLINILGQKVGSCLKLLIEFEDLKITFPQFIIRLKIEIAKFSRLLDVTDIELSLLLRGNKDFIKNIRARINQKRHPDYNPKYKFSRELIFEFIDSLSEIIGVKSLKCVSRLKLYMSINKDIKDYSKQQYTIANPIMFREIKDPEQFYWFGFLCADGWIYSKIYKLGIEISIKDKNHLLKFAKIVGYDKDRIQERIRYRSYKGVIKTYKMIILEFCCRPIVEDLKRHEFLKFKKNRVKIPESVRSVLIKSKEDAKELGINWFETYSGKCALAWLLGYYDGDGTYRGGKGAVIYSSNKNFLETVKKCFNIKNKILTVTKPAEGVDVLGSYTAKTKGLYSLQIGENLFDSFIDSYKFSLERKRPS